MFFNKKTVPAELIRLELPYFDRGSAIVRVYVPEHKKGEKLPVIYMTDGQSVFDEESNPLGCWHTREAVVAEKAASGKSAIIAGIHSDPNPMFRTADLTPASIGKFVPPPMPEGMPPIPEGMPPMPEGMPPMPEGTPPMPEAMTPEIMEQMMKDFQQKSMEVQLKQMSGEQPSAEDMQKIQQLYSIVAMDPLAANHMQNEMRFSIMMKDVYEILGEAIGQGDIIPGVK